MPLVISIRVVSSPMTYSKPITTHPQSTAHRAQTLHQPLSPRPPLRQPSLLVITRRLQVMVPYPQGGRSDIPLKADRTMSITTLVPPPGWTPAGKPLSVLWDPTVRIHPCNPRQSHNLALCPLDGRCVLPQLPVYTSSTTTRKLRPGTILDCHLP